MSVIGPPVKRGVWLDHKSENSPTRYRWSCAACGFSVADESERAAKKLAEAHSCVAGWCAVPMTPERVALLLTVPRIPEPTKEDRATWQRLRELNREARRRRA